MKKQEDSLQIAVCNYIRLQYPKVLFTSDASGIRLTMGQAVKMKKMKSNPGWPDLFLAEPKGKYHGLFIELKRDGERIIKLNGDPVSRHIAEQIEMISILNNKGYSAWMIIGFDNVKKVIDWYFKL